MTPTATTLAQLRPGETGRVQACRVDGDVLRWLDALGIAAGEALTVLRRGAWGGPLHVRAGNGAEFAIGRELAAGVELAPAHTEVLAEAAE